MATKKFIIDTDGAVDDVRSISLALQTPDVEVLAITTVHGIVNVDQVVANISRTLRANRANVPIYRGAQEPLISTVRKFNSVYIFGKDGQSDLPDKFPKVLPKDFANFEPEKPAAVALIELLKKHDDVTLIAIGPLTNIALAIKLDPGFVDRPKEMVIMGGNIYGVGNMGSQFTSEFNFGADPEAAHIVFKCMKCPMTVIPWEAAFFENDSKDRIEEVNFEEHLHLGTPLAEYLTAITTMPRQVRSKRNRQYAFVDDIAMGTAIDPDRVVKEFKMLRATVEVYGRNTRGQVACDWTDTSVCEQGDVEGQMRPIKFVMSYNAKELNQMITAAVQRSQ